MKNLLLLACLAFTAAAFAADTSPPTVAPPAPRHYLIVLKLVPRLHDDQAWTKEDNAAVGAHFNRLKAGVAAGQVLLAGRTKEPGDRTFGLVVFTAADETAARGFMNADPCIVAGVMTGELHPYGLALMAKGSET
ncbi:MAG: YciI family protein [Lacunisphaera sp.]|nr:YciI family protein [Lacunisphaera sp.]